MDRTDPFTCRFEVPVAGGALHVARAGPAPGEAANVVLAAHGVTASLMTWRSVARALATDTTFLAPDLRGRGRSADLPAPYGMAQHVADLVAVLDATGIDRAVMVGHSMGAFVMARLAGEHPERAAGLVLLDAGLPEPVPEDADLTLEAALTNTVMRLSITFPSVGAYLEGWRGHPAFAQAWNDDIEAYARYDLREADHAVRCVASAAAVQADSREMVLDQVTRTALDRVRTPTHLLRAQRGMFDDARNPLIPARSLRRFATAHPETRVESVTGVNHYTLVMGDGHGPERVVAAIRHATAGAAAT